MATVLTELEILQLEIRRQEDIIQTMKGNLGYGSFRN